MESEEHRRAVQEIDWTEFDEVKAELEAGSSLNDI
jgi:hypothetical protein